MIYEIAIKEIKENITSPKVVITYLVCTVLILSAILSGASNYLALREEATVMEAAEKDRISNIYNFQQDYLQTGVTLYRQPSTLSVLVSGVEGDSAREAVVNNYVTEFSVSQFNAKPILALFGMLDMEFIVKMILSLFAILFTFDAISGERERGTLKLNLANDISRSSFIIGKLIGNFVLILLPFVIPLLMGLLILQFIPGIEFSGEEWARTSMLVLGFLLYLVVFYTLGIMVSSLTRSSNISFLVLLMLWVVIIAIVPRGAILVAQALEPVPSVDEIRKDAIKEIGPINREVRNQIMEESADLQRELQRARPTPPVFNTPEAQAKYEKAQAEYQKLVEEKQEEFSRSMTEHMDDAFGRMRASTDQKIDEVELMQEQQNQLAINISRLVSPAAALTFISNRMARTGVYSSDRVFQKNVEALEEGFFDQNRQILEEHPEYMSFGLSQTEAIDLSAYYPDLSSKSPESFAESLDAVLMDYATLALLSIVFIAIAFTAFMRYDVR